MIAVTTLLLTSSLHRCKAKNIY